MLYVLCFLIPFDNMAPHCERNVESSVYTSNLPSGTNIETLNFINIHCNTVATLVSMKSSIKTVKVSKKIIKKNTEIHKHSKKNTTKVGKLSSLVLLIKADTSL